MDKYDCQVNHENINAHENYPPYSIIFYIIVLVIMTSEMLGFRLLLKVSNT